MQDVSAEAIACMVDMSPDEVQDVLGSTARSASGSQQAVMQLAQHASDTLMQLQAGLSSLGTAEEHGGNHCSPDAARWGLCCLPLCLPPAVTAAETLPASLRALPHQDRAVAAGVDAGSAWHHESLTALITRLSRILNE